MTIKVAASPSLVKKRHIPMSSGELYFPSVISMLIVPQHAMKKHIMYDFFTPSLLKAVYAIGLATISAAVDIRTLKNTLPGRYFNSKLIK